VFRGVEKCSGEQKGLLVGLEDCKRISGQQKHRESRGNHRLSTVKIKLQCEAARECFCLGERKEEIERKRQKQTYREKEKEVS
jgi:hypothetical protein